MIRRREQTDFHLDSRFSKYELENIHKSKEEQNVCKNIPCKDS